MIEAKYHALDIAEWFLRYNGSFVIDEIADKISNMKLQKLLYYAQGAYLAIHHGEPLFKESVVAWKHGPVVETIYHKFKDNGANGIDYDADYDLSCITDEDTELLKEVYDTFGQYSAWKLREMTHAETPWLTTAPGGVIPNASIEKYFKENYLE